MQADVSTGRADAPPTIPTHPESLYDHLLIRLALHNCLDGLKRHGRRCCCLDCRGWRSFLRAAGKQVAR
jgi:hypothetical protein